jgi:hypothetical protein
MHKLALSFALTFATLFPLPITPAQAQNARVWLRAYQAHGKGISAAPVSTLKIVGGRTKSFGSPFSPYGDMKFNAGVWNGIGQGARSFLPLGA